MLNLHSHFIANIYPLITCVYTHYVSDSYWRMVVCINAIFLSPQILGMDGNRLPYLSNSAGDASW